MNRVELPKLYDSSEDAAFDDDEVDENEVTQPNRSAYSGIRSFFDDVIEELEEKTRKAAW